VVSPALRLWLSKSLKQRVSGLTILAYTEIPEDQNISVLAKISLSAKLEQEEPSQ
jgi:flagellar biosynthesis component FlhA